MARVATRLCDRSAGSNAIVESSGRSGVNGRGGTIERAGRRGINRCGGTVESARHHEADGRRGMVGSTSDVGHITPAAAPSAGSPDQLRALRQSPQ